MFWIVKWPLIIVGVIFGVWFMFAFPLQAICLTLLGIAFGPKILERATVIWFRRTRLTNLSDYADAPSSKPPSAVPLMTRALFVIMIFLTAVGFLVSIFHG